jgi:DNA-binding NtrC family response regulator
MNNRLFALLLHDHSNTLESLRLALRDLSVETFSVETLEKARRLLPQTQPHLVFTDTSLPDGSWTDVINLAEKAGTPVNVIVVGGSNDMKLYISALERGAFDFVLPPFEHEPLDYVVHSASEDVARRRRELVRAAAA